jgi:hypothetical protein
LNDPHRVLVISGKSLGSRRPLFADFSVPLPPELERGEGGVTLRDLITTIVRQEVQAFRLRQEERRLVHVLSPREIDRGIEEGKIDSGGRDLNQQVNEEQAIDTALQAFEDSLYLVVIDGHEHRGLDQQIYLKPDSRVTFIRLVFLAGA